MISADTRCEIALTWCLADPQCSVRIGRSESQKSAQPSQSQPNFAAQRFSQLSACRRVVTLPFDAFACLRVFVSFDEAAFSFTYMCLLQCMVVLGLGRRRFDVQQTLCRLREWFFMCHQLLSPFHMRATGRSVGFAGPNAIASATQFWLQ